MGVGAGFLITKSTMFHNIINAFIDVRLPKILTALLRFNPPRFIISSATNFLSTAFLYRGAHINEIEIFIRALKTSRTRLDLGFHRFLLRAPTVGGAEPSQA